MIENSCLISQFSTVVIRCMNNFCKIGEKPGKEQMTILDVFPDTAATVR